MKHLLWLIGLTITSTAWTQNNIQKINTELTFNVSEEYRIYDYQEGFLVLKNKHEKYALANTDSEVLTEWYDVFHGYSEGYSIGQDWETFYIIDKEAKVISKPIHGKSIWTSYNDGQILFCCGNNYQQLNNPNNEGLILEFKPFCTDETGEVVPCHEAHEAIIRSNSGGNYLGTGTGSWRASIRQGLSNPEGGWLLPPVFDRRPREFQDGVTIVDFMGKKGLINEQANFILPPKYDEIQYHNNGDIFMTEGNTASLVKLDQIYNYCEGTNGDIESYWHIDGEQNLDVIELTLVVRVDKELRDKVRLSAGNCSEVLPDKTETIDGDEEHILLHFVFNLTAYYMTEMYNKFSYNHEESSYTGACKSSKLVYGSLNKIQANLQIGEESIPLVPFYVGGFPY